jgi:hypothetical protein
MTNSEDPLSRAANMNLRANRFFASNIQDVFALTTKTSERSGHPHATYVDLPMTVYYVGWRDQSRFKVEASAAHHPGFASPSRFLPIARKFGRQAVHRQPLAPQNNDNTTHYLAAPLIAVGAI